MDQDSGSAGGTGDALAAPSFVQGVTSWSEVVRRLAYALVVGAGVIGVTFWLPGWVTQVALVITAGAVGEIGLSALRTGIVIDERGVQIWARSSRDRGAWRWSEISELCLTRTGGEWKLGVRPTGPPAAAPGLTAPAVPSVRGIDGDDLRAQVESVLVHYAALHGLPLTRTREGLGSVPPGSPSRSDA